MADNTLIAWTDYTFNPWMGCFKVSPGCKNCYAENLTSRYRSEEKLWGPPATTDRHVTSKAYWQKPLQWQAALSKSQIRKRVFCGSMCDVFEDHRTANATRPDLWDLIRDTPNLDWQMLTKRPENITSMLPRDWGREGYHNVWLGTSVENQEYADLRIPILSKIPAVVRFLSVEPLIERIAKMDLRKIDWVIVGGESGPGWRPMETEWVRHIRSLSDKAGSAFFFKQSAAPRTEMGIKLDGQIVRNYPEPRMGTVPQKPETLFTPPAKNPLKSKRQFQGGK